MKLKTRNTSLPAECAADAANARCMAFRRMKRIYKLPKKPLSQEVMKQLCG